MKAIYIASNGSAKDSFEIRDVAIPTISDDEVLIKVSAFGINYADVLCRLGLYPQCPPLPAVIGYDVVGTIESIGKNVKNLNIGDRAMALTTFGGYAEFAVANKGSAVKIDDHAPAGEALALGAQYCTAYYCAEELIRLRKDDHVLIHAAAGGVGIALVQIAKMHGCKIFGTAGSAKKLEFLESIGVDHPINYKESDFEDVIIDIVGKRGLDVVFDSIGGETFRKGYSLLCSGGRIVLFGSAEITGRNKTEQLEFSKDYGSIHPAQLMMASKAIIGVFILTVFQDKPKLATEILQTVFKLYTEGKFKPVVDRSFSFDQIAEAHIYLESRKSIGKVLVEI
ncbi:MAG: zinc-binding dehydrogenase [Chitinophagales bacterium]|nr:zinc-binding dehydrogenase [Chitinophagales bacterium]